MLHAAGEAGVEHVAGAVHIDVVVTGAVAAELQHRGEMHDVGDGVVDDQVAQFRIADVHFAQIESGVRVGAQVDADHLVSRGQLLCDLPADVAAGAGDQNLHYAAAWSAASRSALSASMWFVSTRL